MATVMDTTVVIFWVLIALLFHSYLGYFFFLWIIARISPGTKEMAKSVMFPHVAMVIAAYNEEAVIGLKIENCLALDYPRELLSIWVVSDGSTDNTNRIVKDFADKNIQVRLIELPRTGKSGVLNIALGRVD